MKPIIFGGVLRDLALKGIQTRIRDLDVVVETEDAEGIEDAVKAFVERRTRFGGLVLRVGPWRVDVWQLSSTWAIREGLVGEASIDGLLQSTFFNVEALVLKPGREIGAERSQLMDRGALRSFATRILDINLEANPYPSLCVMRTCLLSTELDLLLSPRLARYIVSHGLELTASETVGIQIEHYGRNRRSYERFASWRESVVEHVARYPDLPFKQHREEGLQVDLWTDAELAMLTTHGSA